MPAAKIETLRQLSNGKGKMNNPHEPVRQTSDLVGLIATCQSRIKHAFKICDLLEGLADDLPRRQRSFWETASTQCQTELLAHFEALCKGVIPILIERSQGHSERLTLLNRFSEDYLDRRLAVEGLVEFLSDVMQSSKLDAEPESIGYALRGYFDGIRNSLTWENEILWPLASRLLTEEELKEVAKRTNASHTIH